MKQLREISGEHPVICAGDIFDTWKAPAELINFAFNELPSFFYAIPGQHDLIHHNLGDITKTPYWTLAKAKMIEHIAGEMTVMDKLVLHPFPWGKDIEPLDTFEYDRRDCIHLAVIHKYCWIPGHWYPGADGDSNLHLKGGSSKLAKSLKGYSAAAFGDNHRGFNTVVKHGKEKVNVINCGTFMRRKADEVGYRPGVGLLLKDGTIEFFPLDVSKDEWSTCINNPEAGWVGEDEIKAAELMEFLSSLKDVALDFRDTVNHWLTQYEATGHTESAVAIRSVIREILEECGHG